MLWSCKVDSTDDITLRHAGLVVAAAKLRKPPATLPRDHVDDETSTDSQWPV